MCHVEITRGPLSLSCFTSAKNITEANNDTIKTQKIPPLNNQQSSNEEHAHPFQ
jgi:hypothetical protein